MKRTRTFFVIGTFYVAPILHISYSKVLPWLVPETSAVGAIKKLAIDQLIAAPIILAFPFPIINVVEGRTVLIMLLFDDKIWPVANLINFMFVPIHYQVLWANGVSLLFNAVLSYMHNSYRKEE